MLESYLHKEYNDYGGELFAGNSVFFTISRIFKCILLDLWIKRFYIVIEALDECKIDLQQLLKFVVTITSNLRVKWVVSSRNKRDIEKKLKLDNSQTRLSLELQANVEHLSHAIAVCTDDKVA